MCEYSGRVRDAFTKKGHQAVSCDIIPTESPGLHIQGDALNYLHYPWDMMIAFPPCTHLAASGARWFPQKLKEQADAIKFVTALWSANIPRICIENPIGIIPQFLGPPAQRIQPYWFGVPERKTTCLWLKGLPPLIATNKVRPDNGCPTHTKFAPGPDRGKKRSLTYKCFADNMAEQWG